MGEVLSGKFKHFNSLLHNLFHKQLFHYDLQLWKFVFKNQIHYQIRLYMCVIERFSTNLACAHVTWGPL